MIFPWLIQLAIAVVFQVVSALLRPKPKGPKPEAVRDIEGPTAEADRPVPWIFGSVRLDSPNVIAMMEKSTRTYEVRV